jgi:hypothetical protein
MTFEKDIFVSYAHLDNEPLPEETLGWIERFHRSLSAFMGTRLGRKVNIWRDDRLREGQDFAADIFRQFPNTALLISVVSPRYIESKWCLDEAREFCKSAESTGGLRFDETKFRILKVVKFPGGDENVLPEVMKLQLPYQFFIEEEGARPKELDPVFGETFKEQFNNKVADLAYDLAGLIKKLESAPAIGAADQASSAKTEPAVPLADSRSDRQPEGAAAQTSSVKTKPAVYLADCSKDRQKDREAIKTDLRPFRYPIFPEVQLPMDEESFLAELDPILAGSKLSVHIVGTVYGMVPEGGEKSREVLQNELALQYGQKSGLKRIIWIPTGTRSDQPKQQEFIDTLSRDPDVITGSLEDLKKVIHDTLAKIEAADVPPPSQESAGEERKFVYLICIEPDRMATVPLSKFLKDQGFDVKLPPFTGTPGEISKAFQDRLTDCAAVLIFYGAGDEAWKASVEDQVAKAAGYRATKRAPVTFTYLAGPTNGDKEYLIASASKEDQLIDGISGFSPAALTDFVNTVSGKVKP